MSAFYPVMLNLEGRICVVVGGGEVAARKVQGLLEASAQVTVISTQLHPTLVALAEAGHINVNHGLYESGMLAKLAPLLVFAATDDPAVNQQVAAEARSLGALVNTADEQGERDFINMATVQRGDIAIALSTGGASPELAAHLRGQVSDLIGAEYGILSAWMAQARPIVQASVTAQPARAAIWRRVLESTILDTLRQGDTAAARQQFDDIIQQAIATQS